MCARACVCVCVISNFCVWWTDDWFMKPLFFWWAQCLWWSPAEETVSLRKQADQLLAAALCVDLLILPRECSSVRAITTDDEGLRNSVLHWWHSSTLSCVLHWWQYTTLFKTDDSVQHCSTLMTVYNTVLHCPVFYTDDSIQHCSTLMTVYNTVLHCPVFYTDSNVLHWGQCSTLSCVL